MNFYFHGHLLGHFYNRSKLALKTFQLLLAFNFFFNFSSSYVKMKGIILRTYKTSKSLKNIKFLKILKF